MATWAAVAGSGSPAAAEGSRFVPWPGDATPPLALRDPAGTTRTLADHHGQVVLVNFWATWCEPCLEEMPSLQRLKTRLAGQPFTILAVNYGESPAKIQQFLQRVPVDFPVLLDRDQQAARAWRVRILPASYLVGRDGRVRASVIGELDWASAEAVQAVRHLLP
jgi:thiol-disulfide isomerase/thioredoxin